MSDENNVLEFKITLLGDTGVGKTCLVTRYTQDKFSDETLATAGANFSSRILDLPELQKACKLNIWDTAGQEKYQSIAKIYYLRSNAILLVYDITNRNSFERVKRIYNDVKENVNLDEVMICLVANKNDCYENEEVTREEANEFAKSIYASFHNVSAKTGTGVEQLFEYIGKCLYGNAGGSTIYDQNTFVLENKKNNNEEYKGWCCYYY